MKEIQLTQGKVALVDDEDYNWLNKWNWCTYQSNNLRSSPNYDCCYAGRVDTTDKVKGRVLVIMHRLILSKHKDQVTKEVDHIDNNGLNNQKYNLREVTHKQNMFNQKIRSDNTTGLKGVGKRKDRFATKIKINTNEINNTFRIGSFNTAEEAGLAYNIMASLCFEEHAFLNFKK